MPAAVLEPVRAYRRAGVATRAAVGVLALVLLLVGAALASLAVGPVHIPLSHLWSVALGAIGIDVADHTRSEALVIEQIRLPRILLGGLVGMALGVSGTAMQGLFRNPMADPGIIGVSAGGAVGAVLCLALGLADLFYQALPVFAFLGAGAAALLVYGIAAMGGRFSMATLLLAGVAVSSFLGAVVSLVVALAPTNEAMRSVLFWLAGGLTSRTWEHVRLAAPLILAGGAVMMLLARDLNLLMLGDDEARSLGVRVGPMRLALLGAASLATGAAVAVSGIVAFVGLVVPHVLRIIVGPDHRVLMPASALGGALFVVLADTIARTASQPAELPLGVLTAFVGAPFFLLLLVRNKRRAEQF